MFFTRKLCESTLTYCRRPHFHDTIRLMIFVSVEFLTLTIASYLVGSIPSAYLAARITRGIDIREYGTGNVGLGNLWAIVGRKVAIPVILFDLGKGTGMVAIARLMDLDVTQQVIVGLAAVVGHDWPVFLRFRGGRGVLTSLGLVIIWLPWAILVFTAGAIFTLVLKSSPLPVLVGLALLPLVSWATGQHMAITLGFLVILLIVVIRRLAAGRPVDRVSKRELIINRLLYDRDIRNREEWLYRIPESARLTEEERRRLEKKRRKKGMF